MKKIKKSDVYILTLCLLFSFILIILVYVIDFRAQTEPWRPQERVLKLLLEKNKFVDLIPTDLPYGKIVMINLDRKIDPSYIPAGLQCYGVRFNPPDIVLTIDGQRAENVIGFIGIQGLDWKCDYSEQALSVKSYSPTNGIQSNGDIIRLIRP